MADYKKLHFAGHRIRLMQVLLKSDAADLKLIVVNTS